MVVTESEDPPESRSFRWHPQKIAPCRGSASEFPIKYLKTEEEYRGKSGRDPRLK